MSWAQSLLLKVDAAWFVRFRQCRCKCGCGCAVAASCTWATLGAGSLSRQTATAIHERRSGLAGKAPPRLRSRLRSSATPPGRTIMPANLPSSAAHSWIDTKPVTIVGIAPQGFYGDRLASAPPDFALQQNLSAMVRNPQHPFSYGAWTGQEACPTYGGVANAVPAAATSSRIHNSSSCWIRVNSSPSSVFT